MSLYNLLVLGCTDQSDRHAFVSALEDLIVESGMVAADVQILIEVGGYLAERDPHTPTAVACFSAPSDEELGVVRELLRARAPIIPIARHTERFEDFPEPLQHLNGAKLAEDEDKWSNTAAAVLESVGLLRSQRRLFVSYRRTESRDAAVQLHDQLSERGFQVFLDTHAIRPGKVFQDQLWHSLCDSDVMVMLDTKTYFERKWTREEFGRAQSMGINILRLVFPSHTPDATLELSEQRVLTESDFDNQFLKEDVLEDIVYKIERLRARGMAARHTEMTGKLKSGIEAAGGSLDGAGAYRSVSIRLNDGGRVWAYPIIGVPTANLMQDIARHAALANQEGPYLVYDRTGISPEWLEHLMWLDETIGDVDFMSVSDAADILAKRKAP